MKDEMLGRWNELWGRLGSARNMESRFRELLGAYGGPQRAYHDLSHIRRCLEEFEHVRSRLEHPDEVELAIWFHDIIYDPRSDRNEEDSAAHAAAEMKNADIGEEAIKTVTDFILATKHDRAINHPDADYLMDIDIATLGSTPEIYRQYEKDIRKEYEWASESIYRKKRREILMSFLKRDQIYRTPYFRQKYENKAKTNLEREIRALNGGDESAP